VDFILLVHFFEEALEKVRMKVKISGNDGRIMFQACLNNFFNLLKLEVVFLGAA